MATHFYEKLGEDMKPMRLPINDFDGSITGKIVINVPAYFDENPDEQRRLGWIKHIEHNDKDDPAKPEYDPQTQYLIRSVKQIDDYTVEDVYHVMDKSEEQMLLEEMLEVTNFGGNFIFLG